MADRKISDLTALTAPAAGDYLPIVDISEVAAASKNKRITIEELFRGTPDGTAAAPAIAPESDPNTGIYSSGADQLSIATNGTERLRIDSAGQIEAVSLGTAAAPTFSFTGDPNTGIYSPGADQLAISTGGTGRLFIDASGNVGQNGPPFNYVANARNFQINGTGYSAVTLGTTDAITDEKYWRLIARTAGPDKALQLQVINDSGGGEATAYTVTRSGSSISSQTWNTSGSERMRLTSAGNVGIGTTSPEAQLHIAANNDSPITTGIRVARTTIPGQYVNLNYAVGLATLTAVDTVSGVPAFKFQTSTNGSTTTERARIDSNGYFYIGTTNNPAAAQLIVTKTGGAQGFEFLPGSATTTNTVLHYNRAGSAYLTSTVNALDHTWQTSGTERARLDSSGRLLVGTSSARSGFFNGNISTAVQVEGSTTSTCSLSITRNGVDADSCKLVLAHARGTANQILVNGDAIGEITWQGADGAKLVQAAQIFAQVDGTPGVDDMPGRLVFSTTADGAASPTERMRITSDGKIYVNTASAIGGSGAFLHVNATNNAAIFKGSTANQDVINTWNAATSGDNIFVNLGTEASFTSRGTIDYNRAAGQIRYNVTSDRRLKSDIQPAASALDSLSALQVRAYKWTETDYQVHYGFIAQELNEIVPDAVKVGDDNEEVTDAWSVDTGKLVPLLTKALQEAMERIESLEAKVAALEGE
jgi:hypothetical protein